MNDYVKGLLEQYVPCILSGDSVAVPDDAEEMNWRLFFSHSQDMQGFRADIFTGGQNEPDPPGNPQFAGLRDRFPDSQAMIRGLAELWDHATIQEELCRITHPLKPVAGALQVAQDLLLGPSGNEASRAFASTLEELKGNKIARKTAKMVRAYVQNSHFLRSHGSNFQHYLRSVTPEFQLPVEEAVHAERAWRTAISRDFYNVGPALSHYLVCDWLLWLWREGTLGWFESYKADSVFVGAGSKLPQEAANNFVEYSRTLKMQPEWAPAGRSYLIDRPLPPRLLNEAIWLRENANSSASSPVELG